LTGYILSPAAAVDLDKIWDYGEERWGVDRAESYAREIQAAIETVARDPRRGRPCDDVRQGYRSFSVGSHVLFFRLHPLGVDIVRVLHQRMDFHRHL
jgi:toxin ParE1/3/4